MAFYGKRAPKGLEWIVKKSGPNGAANTKPDKPSKLRNKKCLLPDGTQCDSKKEARRLLSLRTLEKVGRITNLRHQVKFELIPKQTKPGGGTERAVNYVADFVYTNEKGAEIVEDAKSPASRKLKEYVIKRKLMLFFHGVEILET